MNLTPAAIVGLTEIALQLFQDIEAAVQASNNAELQQAWIMAQEQFNLALANNPTNTTQGNN